MLTADSAIGEMPVTESQPTKAQFSNYEVNCWSVGALLSPSLSPSYTLCWFQSRRAFILHPPVSYSSSFPANSPLSSTTPESSQVPLCPQITASSYLPPRRQLSSV